MGKDDRRELQSPVASHFVKSILLFPCGIQKHNLFFLAPQENTFYQSFHPLCAVPDFGLKGVSQKGGAGPEHSGPYPQKKHSEDL